MAYPSQTLYNSLLRAFLSMGKARAYSTVPSSQLRSSLNTVEFSDSSGAINVPHYWARYYNDGRGPSPRTPGKGKVLVWFRNHNNDPRLRGGKYPVKINQRKRLSRADFKKWSSVNQTIISRYKKATGKRVLTASDYKSMNLPMIVSKNSPRNRTSVTGKFFFENKAGGGMHGFAEQASIEGKKIASSYIKNRLQKQGILKLTKTRRVYI